MSVPLPFTLFYPESPCGLVLWVQSHLQVRVEGETSQASSRSKKRQTFKMFILYKPDGFCHNYIATVVRKHTYTVSNMKTLSFSSKTICGQWSEFRLFSGHHRILSLDFFPNHLKMCKISLIPEPYKKGHRSDVAHGPYFPNPGSNKKLQEVGCWPFWVHCHIDVESKQSSLVKPWMKFGLEPVDGETALLMNSLPLFLIGKVARNQSCS